MPGLLRTSKAVVAMAQFASAQGSGSSVAQKRLRAGWQERQKVAGRGYWLVRRSFLARWLAGLCVGTVGWITATAVCSRFSLFAWACESAGPVAGWCCKQKGARAGVGAALLAVFLGGGRSSAPAVFWVRCRRAKGVVRVGWVRWDRKGPDY